MFYQQLAQSLLLEIEQNETHLITPSYRIALIKDALLDIIEGKFSETQAKNSILEILHTLEQTNGLSQNQNYFTFQSNVEKLVVSSGFRKVRDEWRYVDAEEVQFYQRFLTVILIFIVAVLAGWGMIFYLDLVPADLDSYRPAESGKN